MMVEKKEKKTIVRQVEKVKINGHEVLARIDTGADRSSISEEFFERFKEKPIIKYMIVKSSNGKVRRPVTSANILIAGRKISATFNVSDRKHMRYDVLIGNNILKKGFIVDYSEVKIGIISLGGRSSKKLAKSCKKYFDSVDELDLREFKVRLTNEGYKITYKDARLKDYDCLYVRGSYRYAMLQRAITRALKKNVYMPIKPEAFTLGHDKFLTMLELQQNKVDIPKTYYAPTTQLAKEILQNEVKFPVIMKLQQGTHGKGVMIADSLQSGKTILDMLDHFEKPYIIQEFVPTKNTSDIRALVVRNKVIAAYQRLASKEEIRTNIHSGGKRKKHILTPVQEKIAIASAKAIGAEICGVDIFNSDKPSIIEVNLSPSFANAKRVTGVDISKEIAKSLYLGTLKFKQKKERIRKKKLDKKAKKKKKKIT